MSATDFYRPEKVKEALTKLFRQGSLSTAVPDAAVQVVPLSES